MIPNSLISKNNNKIYAEFKFYYIYSHRYLSGYKSNFMLKILKQNLQIGNCLRFVIFKLLQFITYILNMLSELNKVRCVDFFHARTKKYFNNLINLQTA